MLWANKVVFLCFPTETSMLCTKLCFWGCALVQVMECAGAGFVWLSHSVTQGVAATSCCWENIPPCCGGSGMDVRYPSQNFILRSEHPLIPLRAMGKGTKQPRTNIWRAGIKKKIKPTKTRGKKSLWKLLRPGVMQSCG